MLMVGTLVSTCICTDWQLTNSTDETTLSRTMLVFLHESKTIELTFPDGVCNKEVIKKRADQCLKMEITFDLNGRSFALENVDDLVHFRVSNY